MSSDNGYSAPSKSEMNSPSLTLSIGFTGTRHGMTWEQRDRVLKIVRELVSAHRGTSEVWTAHHGDCIGAAAQFHEVARHVAATCIVIHPGPKSSLFRAGCRGDDYRDELPFMQRNKNIVIASTVMIAAPSNDAPSWPRGGTWRTIAMTRAASRPLMIVFPSGDAIAERLEVRSYSAWFATR